MKLPWKRRLLAQHLADTTPRGKGENPIAAAFWLVVSLVVLVGGALLTVRGCK
jgi:hypothetical protein